MATFASRRLHTMLRNVSCIVASELLASAQGVEFHAPQQTSGALRQVLDIIRSVSARYETDRSLSSDIESLADRIDEGAFCEFAKPILPSFGG